MNPPAADGERGAARLHLFATGLLAAMAGLYLAAGLFLEQHPWLGYVRAFAEAAMVGALADWFAVVALFRRPLGLPIPHTAVVPRNKERIGDSLGRFVEEHFLAPGIIRARLDEVDFAARLGAWLARPEKAEALARRLAALLPGLLNDLDNEAARAWSRQTLTARLARLDPAPLAADMLDAAAAAGRHQRLLDAAMAGLGAWLAEEAPALHQKISDRTGWLWKKLSVDDRAFAAVMGALGELFAEVEADPGHALRERLDTALRGAAGRLREDADWRAKAAALRDELLGAPFMQDRLGGAWEAGRDALLADLESQRPETARLLAAALAHAGRRLAGDAELRAPLDAWLRDTVAALVESHRADLARLIPDTLRTWDADTLAARLEAQVGADLQFIRINGTLVGGLVGLALYAGSRWLG